MKRLMSILGVMLLHTSGFSSSPIKTVTPTQVKTYQLLTDDTVVLPSEFAKNDVIRNSDLTKLHSKKIHHIDLVYTQFKRSPLFDQAALNQSRINKLIQMLPKINQDKPTWRLIEQTGAQTTEVANDYFHGFVIHFSEPIDYKELSRFFGTNQPNASVYNVSNDKDINVSYSSGTQIHLQANSVNYQDGTPVKGSFNLHYTEYRNPAEIAFSGIPMTYEKNGTSYNFSSVGMYKITAEQDGKELRLNKPATVDFLCTEQKKDVAFYKMDDKGVWEEKHAINFDKEVNASENTTWPNDDNSSKGIISTYSNGMTIDFDIKPEECVAKFNDAAWESYQELKNNNAEFDKIVLSTNDDKKQLTIKDGNQSKLGDLIFQRIAFGPAVDERNFGQFDNKPIPNDKNATLLGSNANAGHTYPKMVRGLNSDSFGVYNCDQIYRIGKTRSLSPSYVDAQTGEKIENPHVVCVLDLNYNGSFSFHPNNLVCNAEGKNVILLFTDNKEVFLLNTHDFSQLNLENYNPVFKMTDMSSQIKNSDDLASYLGL